MDAKLLVVGGKVNKKEIQLKLPTIIGRSRSADLTVAHPLVSRQHCLIYERDGALVVKDNGSLNGTFVAGLKISETVLKPGDKLTVGPLTFVVIYEHQGAFPDVVSSSLAASTVQEFVTDKPTDEPNIDFRIAELDPRIDLGEPSPAAKLHGKRISPKKTGKNAENEKIVENALSRPLSPKDFAAPPPPLVESPNGEAGASGLQDIAPAKPVSQSPAVQPAVPESAVDLNWLEHGSDDGLAGAGPLADGAASGIGLPTPASQPAAPSEGPAVVPTPSIDATTNFTRQGPSAETAPLPPQSPTPGFLAGLAASESSVAPEATLDFTLDTGPRSPAAASMDQTLDVRPTGPPTARDSKAKQGWWPFGGKKKEPAGQPPTPEASSPSPEEAPAAEQIAPTAEHAPSPPEPDFTAPHLVAPDAPEAPSTFESLDFASLPQSASPNVDDNVAAWLDDTAASPSSPGQDDDLDDFLKNLGNQP